MERPGFSRATLASLLCFPRTLREGGSFRSIPIIDILLSEIGGRYAHQFVFEWWFESLISEGEK